MAVHIHHVNIRTRDLDATIAFYTDVVGLTKGWRPPFTFPGAWLYDGDKAAVHLTLVAKEPPYADAALDHVAFSYEALDPVLARLDGMKVNYTRPKHVPGTEIRQCFLRDPNGVTVELQGP